MKIGKYKISLVKTANFSLDGGAMFGIIPKPLWNRNTECDDLNRVKLGTSCLLLQSNSKNIIIDTGIGNGWDEKFKSNNHLDYSNYTLENSLNQKNLKVDNITDVILTHLHFDHVGGAVNYIDGKIVPMFPHAKYHSQLKQFEWAKNPSPKDKGSFIESRFIPLFNEGVLNLIDGDSQIDDEIFLLTSNGHTFDQQLVKISDGNSTLLHGGDIFPTSAHIPIPYITGYDIQPLITVEEKIKLLAQAVDEEWKIFFEHDLNCDAATITKNEKGFKIKERFIELV